MTPLRFVLKQKKNESKGLRPILHQVMFPLTVMVLLTMVIFTTYLLTEKRRSLRECSQNVLNNVSQRFFHEVNEHAGKISAIQDIFLFDKDFLTAVKSEDRNYLLENYLKLFFILKNEHAITHFNLIDEKGNIILRFHEPQSFGDKIERYTLTKAQDTGKRSYGIETGVFGTMVLRNVIPIHHENSLVGYLEIGKEIKDILDEIHSQTQASFTFFIDKDKIYKEAWAKTMSTHGFYFDWNLLSEKVIIYSNFKVLPEEIIKFLRLSPNEISSQTYSLKIDKSNWQLMFLPVPDVSGKIVGNILIMNDITEIKACFRRRTSFVLLLSLTIVIIICFIIYSVLKKADKIANDMNEKQKISETLRISEERLRLAQKATNDVIWDWDILNNSQKWSPSGKFVFGWTEIVDRPVTAEWWVEKVHPEDKQRVEESFFSIVNNPEKDYWTDEYRFRKADGTYAEVVDRGYVIRNNKKEAIRMIGAMLDITPRKEAEKRISTLLAEKEILLRETHHRIKNNMNTLKSILLLEADMQKNPEVIKILEDAASRIQSMTTLYEKMYQAEDYYEMNAEGYFETLINEIFKIFPQKIAVKRNINIKNISLSPREMFTLGLIVNELVTNSLKHAFANIKNPEIDLKAFMQNETVVLIYSDNGKGLPKDLSFQNTLGLQLVKMLVRQLKATLSFENNKGAVFIIHFEPNKI